MTEIEYIGDVEVSMEWAEQFLRKSKKLANEYDVIMKKQYGNVFNFLVKRKGMKYEYGIVRIAVIGDGVDRMALFNVFMLDKKMIEDIAKIVLGGDKNEGA